MKYIIKMECFADGRPSPINGQYLKSFDHEAHDGLGDGTFTLDKAEAMAFEDQSKAFEFWMKQSTVRPLRIDGKPNKPLTASTVSILPLEEE